MGTYSMLTACLRSAREGAPLRPLSRGAAGDALSASKECTRGDVCTGLPSPQCTVPWDRVHVCVGEDARAGMT